MSAKIEPTKPNQPRIKPAVSRSKQKKLRGYISSSMVFDFIKSKVQSLNQSRRKRKLQVEKSHQNIDESIGFCTQLTEN